MPILIDQIDTEIEVTPRPGAATRGDAAAAARPTMMTADDLDRRVVSVLERELETYLRMRG